MSYLSEAIEFERSQAFDRPGVNPPREPIEAFEAGLLAGAEIVLRAYGIWRNGSQRVGAADKAIKEVLGEFRAALAESCDDSSKEEAMIKWILLGIIIVVVLIGAVIYAVITGWSNHG